MGALQEFVSHIQVPDWLPVQDGGTIAFILFMVAAGIYLLSEAMKKVLEDWVAKNLTAWRIGMILLYGVPILYSLRSGHYWTAAFMAVCCACMTALTKVKHRSFLTRPIILFQLVALIGTYWGEDRFLRWEARGIKILFVLPYDDMGLEEPQYKSYLSNELLSNVKDAMTPVASIAKVQPSQFDDDDIKHLCPTCPSTSLFDRLNHQMVRPSLVLQNEVSGNNEGLNLVTSLCSYEQEEHYLRPVNFEPFSSHGKAEDAGYLALESAFFIFRAGVQDRDFAITPEQETQINRQFLEKFEKALQLDRKHGRAFILKLKEMHETTPITVDDVWALLQDYDLSRETKPPVNSRARKQAFLAKLPSNQ